LPLPDSWPPAATTAGLTPANVATSSFRTFPAAALATLAAAATRAFVGSRVAGTGSIFPGHTITSLLE
jgi:hypothetical protein